MASRRQGRPSPPEAQQDPADRQGAGLIPRGLTGIRRYGQFIDEEYEPRLRGLRAVRVYERMGHSAGIGAALFMLEALVSQVRWSFDPPEGAAPEAARWSDFFNEVIGDMATTMVEVAQEAATAIQYGHAVAEVTYKIRRGPGWRSPELQSRYSDGLVGIRDISPRAQDSLYEWDLDDDGVLHGIWQRVEGYAQETYIPASKLVVFTVRPHKRNPLGRPPTRNAYRAWFFKSLIEEYEAIGIERNLDGMPAAFVPMEYLSAAATADQRAYVDRMERICRRIRRDEQEGLVLPARTTQTGDATGFDFELLNSGIDPSKADPVVQRYRSDELVAFLSNFLALGSQPHGSYSMFDANTNLVTHALATVLAMMRQRLQESVFDKLSEMNRIPADQYPQLAHSDIEKVDLGAWTEGLLKLQSAGVLVPQDSDESRAREMFGLPPKAEAEADAARPPPPRSADIAGQRLDDAEASLETLRAQLLPDEGF